MLNNKLALLLCAIFILTLNPVLAQTPIATFAVIGDFGSGNGNETAVATEVKSWTPDFIITVGDNIYDLSSYSDAVGDDYHEYMYPHDPNYPSDTQTENRFWAIVGNHDWTDLSINAYIAYFTSLANTNNNGNHRYYTKKIGDIEFFAIDSDTHEPDGTSYTSTQGIWIQQQIQSSTAKWKIVLFHHPAYSSGGDKSYMRWPFEDWGVDAVIMGHIHNYERILKNDNGDGRDLVYFVNGLGGAGIKPFGSNFISGSQAHYDSEHGAMKVVETTSSLEFSFINKNGTTIDSYTNNNPFPVQLAFFTANLNGSNVELRWRTETETNNFGFEIERQVPLNSTEGGNNGEWATIGFVEGNGNSNSPKRYSYVDNKINQSGKYYYRLKQIDNDGTFEYSNISTVEVGVPNNYYLSQNYPNPFNPTTKINFTLPEKQNVSLRVYNVLGEMVNELINEEKPAGSYSVTFNSSNLPSGIYVYRLQTQNFAENRKMTLLK